MINQPKGLSVFSKGILTFIFLVFSFGVYAEDTVSFLGEESGISDRTIRSGGLLSEYLEGVEDFCLSEEAEENNNGKKDKTVKKQEKCLKKLVKPLSKHKPTDISKAEKKILKNIIKAFKKNGGVIDPEPEVLLSTVNGRVTEPNGGVVAGANISVIGSDATATTGADGRFSLELEADKEYVLQLSADDYANQVSPVKSPTENGVVNLDLTMIARGAVQTFSAEFGTPFGSPLLGNDGASVSLQPNSFVYANGNPVIGEIQLTITPVDVSNPNSLAAFPGEFTGTIVVPGIPGSVDTPIISFGTVEYVFTQNGIPVQLAPEVTADISIPIYIATNQDGTDIELDDEIPLWSLNEETGIWLQEGTGFVVSSPSSPTGLAMEAEVSHFTWWNCDVSMNAALAIVTVTGSQAGTALIKATTTANIGGRSGTVDTVTNIGVPTPPLNIPSNGEVCFSANVTYIDGSSGTTAENCVEAVGNTTVEIFLTASVPGDVNIVANGSDGDFLNPVSVIAFNDFAIDKIRLYPVTTETSVTYSIVSGVLPAGLSLNTVDALRAEIVGTPTVAGIYSVTVEATDSDSTTDSVIINFDVSSDEPAPDLDSFFYIDTNEFSYQTDAFDLNEFNNGGQVTNWELDYIFQFEQEPPPSEIVLDPNTGILTMSSCTDAGGFNIYWYGIVIATNSSGSSQADIQVSCGIGLD